MALDKLTTVTNTAQLFIWQVHAESEVNDEESASVNNPRGKTMVKTIFKENEETLIQCNLKWNPLRCVTTVDDKNMCGAGKGFLDKFTKVVKM